MNTSHEHLRIGAVARACGVSIDTIRYYEREGLIPPPRRRSSGYRDYDHTAIRRLHFIRSAKQLGFSLEDIRELLALSTDSEHGVTGVKQRARARLELLDQRLHQLQRMRDGLQALVEDCPGHGEPDACPILQALAADDVEASR